MPILVWILDYEYRQACIIMCTTSLYEVLLSIGYATYCDRSLASPGVVTSEVSWNLVDVQVSFQSELHFLA